MVERRDSFESRWLTQKAYDMLVTKMLNRAQEILAIQGVQYSTFSLRTNRVALMGRVTGTELCNESEVLAQRLAQRVVDLIPKGWLTDVSTLGDFFRVAQSEGYANARRMHSFLLDICQIHGRRYSADPMETTATLRDVLDRIRWIEMRHGRDFAMQHFFKWKPVIFRGLNEIMERHGLSLFESPE